MKKKSEPKSNCRQEKSSQQRKTPLNKVKMAGAVAVVVEDNEIEVNAQSALRVMVSRQLCEILIPTK